VAISVIIILLIGRFGHIGIEKRAAAAPPVLEECPSTVGTESANSKKIFNQLINAIQRRNKPFDRELATNQFGFLYMHGTTPNVKYDDPEVKKVMEWTAVSGKGKQLPGLRKPLPDNSPLPNKIIWPAKAATTNFQFAKPTPEAMGRTTPTLEAIGRPKPTPVAIRRPSNIGHAEEQLLNSFNIMADNFITRYKMCPCYVILGKSWQNIFLG
jgi:hypothetical protein